MAAPAKPNPSVSTVTEADDAEKLNVVETPTSPSSGLALCRFEFETGKANEGTKILMVDWDASAATPDEGAPNGPASEEADWEVSWEGKTTVLPTRDSSTDSFDEERSGNSRRVFFLLPPGALIPPLVTISRGKKGSGGRELHTQPMPAIFHPALGMDVRDVGTRGVLHTIWAKKRLSELQAEIDQEMKANGESVGLEMALQEKQWIIQHFGIPGLAAAPSAGLRAAAPPLSPSSPKSPRSPVGKLGEKLKGLKLATSPTDLAAASQAARMAPISSLSPGAADVAVSSFASFHTSGQGGLSAGSGVGVASLNAVMGGGTGRPAISQRDTGDTEEDLFALPMSPRSPEMKRSPFSLLS